MSDEKDMTTPKLDTAGLRAALEAGTAVEGDWTVRHSRAQAADAYTVLDANGMWVADCGNAPDDAALIALAVNSAPLLLASLTRLQARDAELTKEVADLKAAWNREFATGGRYQQLWAMACTERDTATAALSTAHAQIAELRGLLGEALDAWEDHEPSPRIAAIRDAGGCK